MTYGEDLRKFVAPEFVFGVGARFQAGQYLRNYGIRKVLLVTDNGVMEAGWVKQIIQTLEQSNIDYTVFSNVTPNPRHYQVMEGADVYMKHKCNGILVVGGGSPIDAAKGIGIVVNNGGNILDYEGVDEIEHPIPPLICIPTTAGSSADVSQFAIISDRDRKVKIAIISKTVVPDVSLIDPETTITLSKELTAATGMDALTHSIEALVSNASSPITDMHCLNSIKYIFDALPKAINDLQDIEARIAMSMGSLLAGLAFSNASLGVVHAMAHALGGLFDLPHGECNAILLPYVLKYNETLAAEKLSLMKGCFENEQALDTDWLINKVQQLSDLVGIENSLAGTLPSHEELNKLVANTLNDACIVTNPREANSSEIKDLYESVFRK